MRFCLLLAMLLDSLLVSAQEKITNTTNDNSRLPQAIDFVGNTDTLTGTVVDSSGGLIAGATVLILRSGAFDGSRGPLNAVLTAIGIYCSNFSNC